MVIPGVASLGVIVPASGCCFATGWVVSIIGVPSGGGVGAAVNFGIVGVGVSVTGKSCGFTEPYAAPAVAIVSNAVVNAIPIFISNLSFDGRWTSTLRLLSYPNGVNVQ